MLRRLGNWLGATRLPAGASHWTPDWLVSAGLPPTRAAVDPQQLAAALRCASILSDSLASQPAAVTAPVTGGGREKLTTDASRALQRTAYSDWETALLSASLGGNGFLHIHRNDRNGPHKLVAIPSRLVSVAIDAQGRVWYERMADESLGITEAVLPASDVVHIKARSTDNPLVGVSPLRAAGASVANVIETVTLQRSLFQNLAQAGLVFSSDLEMSADQMKQLTQRVNEKTKNLAAGGSLVLSHGLKIDRGGNGNTATDSELVQALEFSVREIARTYGIPPSMLAQADQSSYSTASEEYRSYLTATLMPWAARVASELTAKLLTDADQTAGHSVAYDFTSALLGHGAERAETLSKMVNAGIVSPNEARNWQGLQDVQGGDTLRSPVNTYPLPEWLDYGPDQPTATPAPTKAITSDRNRPPATGRKPCEPQS
ncbi:MAG: phage portal protein [Shimia thalassica]|uniref:phage portal protein n=1 Tax=Shimia thalassica TaxID=1715693 RepID=UPI0032987BF3